MVFKCHLCNQNTIKRTARAVSGRQFSSCPSTKSMDQSPTLLLADTHRFAQTIQETTLLNLLSLFIGLKTLGEALGISPTFLTKKTLLSHPGTPGAVGASAVGIPGPLHMPLPCLERSSLLITCLAPPPPPSEPPQLLFTYVHLCFPGLLKSLLPNQAP